VCYYGALCIIHIRHIVGVSTGYGCSTVLGYIIVGGWYKVYPPLSTSIQLWCLIGESSHFTIVFVWNIDDMMNNE
jgi:hypothetical protein